MSLVAAQLVAKVTADTKPAEEGLQRVGEHANKTGGFLKGVLGHALSLAGGFAAVKVGSMAFDFLKDQIGDTIAKASEAQQVMAQTNAVLKSTHGAAGMSAQAVGDLATKLMNLTGIDDDAVQSAENILLTFTGIGKKAFPDATKATLDMATAMHMDLNQAALVVGKALNDPVAGMTALRREGVTLSKSQQDLVKHFMATGQKAKAQKIILGELKKEFGGSAEAAGKTFGGQMKKLGAIFDNVKETVGGKLLPVLTGFLQNVIIPLATNIGNHLGPILDRLGKNIGSNVGPAFSRLSAFFTANILPALQSFGTFIQQQILPALASLGQFILNNVIPTVLSLAAWMAKNVLPVIETLGQVFVQNILPALEGIWTSIQQNLIPALQKLWEKIEPILIPALKLVGWILQHVVGPAIGLLIKALGGVIDVVANVIGWVSDKLGGAFDFLGKKVIPYAKHAFTDFKDHVAKIWDSITTTAKGAINSVIDIINGLIRAIDSIKIHVPRIDLPGGGSIGGNDISFPQIPTLPHLAAGGRILDAGMALVGERGPERLFLPRGAAVAPLPSGGGGGGGGAPIHVHIHVAGRRVADAILPDMVATIRNRTGVRL